MREVKGGVVREAGFLMASQLICSVIGLLYRSPLHSIMGNIGDGYYSYAYEWYTIVLLLSSYSIPTAISKVMADRIALKRYRDTQKMFKTALLYVAVVGGAGALVLYFGAPVFLSTQPDAVLALRILAPTVLLSGFLGCLRGYFQAHNSTFPTAVSRIVEQIVNAAASIAAAWLFARPFTDDNDPLGVQRGIYGAAGGTLGTGAGVLTGLIFMGFVYYAFRGVVKAQLAEDEHERTESTREAMNTIFLMVTPIIFSTCIYNASTIVNQSIFNRIMDFRGYRMDASALYGLYSYQVKPILNIPIGLASATATALIPAVASATAVGDRKEAHGRISESLRLSAFIAYPAAVGIAVLSYPIIDILYAEEVITESAFLLAVGSVSIIFYSMSTVTNGILQGLGYPRLPVIHSAIALAADAGFLAVLLLTTDLGVRAVLYATILYSLCVCVLNARSMKKIVGYRHDPVTLVINPLCGSIAMAIPVAAVYWIPALLLPGVFSHKLASAALLGVSVLVGIVTYIAVYMKHSGLGEDDVKRLPMGRKLLVLMKKMKVM